MTDKLEVDYKQEIKNTAQVTNVEGFSNKEKINKVRNKLSRSERLLNLFEEYQKEEKITGSEPSEKRFINYLKNNKRFYYLSESDQNEVVKIISKSDMGTDERINTVSELLGNKKNLFIKNLISQKNDGNKDDLRKQLRRCFITYDITNAVGYHRRDSRDYLARKAGIQDYNPDDRKIGIKQNEKIRDWFLDKILEINEIIVETKQFLAPKLQKVLDTVSMEKGRVISTTEALSALTDKQQQQLNKMTEERFKQFLLTLSQKGDELGKKYENNLGASEKVGKDLGKCLMLSNSDFYQENVINILAKDSQKDPQEIKRALTIPVKDIQAHFEKTGQPIPKEGSLDREIARQVLQESKLDQYVKNNASSTAKAEIQELKEKHTQEIFKIAQEYNFTEDLKQIRGSEYYTQVEQSYISTQTIDNKLSSLDISTKVPVESQQDWKKFSNNIINNDVFNQEESKLKELPEIVFSDLQKFKPIPVEYQSLLGKDGNLDISLMQKQNVPQDLQQKLLTIYSPDKIKTSVEQQLLQETNDVMKSHLTQQVVQFLQELLNMEIDQQGKENIIEQFKDIKNNNKNQNLIVEGNYQGQKIRFVYDLTTGEFKSNDRMSKDKGELGIQINGDSLSSLGIRGPNIVDILDTAKNLDYQTITNKSNGDISKYNQLCEKDFSLKQSNYSLDNKDTLKTQYLKTILSQEMVDMVGLSKPESKKTIDTNLHPIYKKIYDSVTNYSLEELQEMRKNMKNLISLNSQIKDSSLSENEEDLAKETKNKAKKVLLTLFKEQKKEQQKPKDNRFADCFFKFFSSFDSLRPRGSEQVKVIDPKKILAFIADVEGTTYDGAIAYDQTKLQENMSSYTADSDLDKQLDQMNFS